MINRHNLARNEKFPFLHQHSSNAPKILKDSLDIGNQSHECAKLLLQQVFDQTERYKQDVIKSLANLELQPNADPYKFIGEMRSIAHRYFRSSILQHNNRRFYDTIEFSLWALIVFNYILIKIRYFNPYQLLKKLHII